MVSARSILEIEYSVNGYLAREVSYTVGPDELEDNGQRTSLPIQEAELTTPVTLPHSIETEQALLGACLNEGMCPSTAPGDFYLLSHQVICQAMRDLDSTGTSVDLVTLYDALVRGGSLDSVGGSVYLHVLAECVTSGRNIDAYEEIVQDKAKARRFVQLCAKTLQQAETLHGSNDILPLMEDFHKTLARIDGGGPAESTVDSWRRFISEIERNMNRGGGLLGVPTGLSDLDRIISGLVPGDLIVVAARPSMGKTALAVTMTLNAARRGHSVLFFSLEMPKMQLLYRLAAQGTELNLQSLRTGTISHASYEHSLSSMTRLAELPITIDDRSGISVIEISHLARKLKPVVLFVDYLQLLKPAKREERRDLEVAAMTFSLFTTGHLLYSQRNREANGYS